MLDHTENNLRAAIKSLTDVVMPALDPADPMAREQLALVVAFLEFTRSRVYDIHARQRVELGHEIALARDVSQAAAELPGAADRLAAGADAARHVLDDAQATTWELRDAAQVLGAAVRGVIREARAADPAIQERIQSRVAEGSQPLLALHGAWFAPLGLDPQAAAAQDLSALLGRDAEPAQ